tara:strand:+ start:2900 stop:3085 length:186 start_codon:yes stop_codon:yes gene_type:complete
VRQYHPDFELKLMGGGETIGVQDILQRLDFPHFSGHASITPSKEIYDARYDHGKENPALQR